MGKSPFPGWGGQVLLLVQGDNLTQFLNMAVEQGILLWDMKRTGEKQLLVWAQSSDVRYLHHIARAAGLRFIIRKRKGTYFWLLRVKRRKVMAFGLVLSIALLYFLSSFIWSVTVTGNKQVSTYTVLQAAARGGLVPGVARRKVDPVRVEAAIRESLPEVAWAGVYVEGTKAIIEVAERALPRPLDRQPANIVAGVSALVSEVLVRSGQALVKPGETVQSGQVLISGQITTTPQQEEDKNAPAPQVELVHARGIVRARVWYEGYGEARVIATGERPTGGEAVTCRIVIGGREIILWGPRTSPFPLYRSSTLIKRIPAWRNIKLPVELIITRYYAYEKYRENRGMEAARRLASLKAWFDALSKRGFMGQVAAKRFVEVRTRVADNLVREKVYLEVIQDIGREKLISQ